MRLVLVLVLVLVPALAGCAEEPTSPPVEVEDAYFGGGVAELDDDTGGASLWVDVPADARTMRMELVYTAIGSLSPRVYGVPGCEWRIHAPYTETRTETIDCAGVAPGHHEVRVEHDGGELRMAVRILGTVPKAVA